MMRNWLQRIGGLIGASLIFVMLFANQLGFDNDPVWGARRYFLFFVGLFILIISLAYREGNIIGRAFHTSAGRSYLFIGITSGLVMIAYIWYTSVGLWTTFPNETSYYDLLANAFRHRQLAVDVQPDHALLNMENVYEPGNREGIPMLWDASLYEGKYYLYWGPSPALFLAIFKLFSTQEVGDKVVTFVFVVGTLLFAVLLILELWKQHFSQTPLWAVLAAIVFTGLANPILYILTEARIYEAAIIAAQFFLVGGMYWLFSSFNRPSHLRLILAGSFLALAVGSRTTLTFSVASLALIALIWAIKTQKPRSVSLTLAFAIPLALGAIAYASYNYVRFDSFTEFGLTYQLTSYNLNESLGKTFSLEYIPPNLYKTLFNTLETRAEFPYLILSRWTGPVQLGENLPEFYLLFAEAITGIFAASPFMVFAFLAGWKEDKNFRWVLFSLIGSAFFAFLMLQVFFFTTMRYLLDLTPTLSILAVTGFWQALIKLKKYHVAQNVFSIIALLLLVYTVSMALILPIIGHLESYRVFNPALLEQITWQVNNFVK